MKTLIFRRNKRGNTLVEVMISIAVVSSVILGAFYVTQRSVISVRDGQEHTEMLQILQGQVEHVRETALNQRSSLGGVFSDGDFCIDMTPGGSYQRVDANSVKCKNQQDRYDVKISYDKNTSVFTFVGSWDGISGSKNQETMTYRVYSNEPVAGNAAAPAYPAPAPGNPSGQAEFDSGGSCGSIGKPSCTAIKPGGSYGWNFTVYNRSINDTSLVKSCTWNWDDIYGDRTPITYPGTHPNCQYGAKLSHNYARPPGLRPWPDDCNLTLHRPSLSYKIEGVSPDPVRVISARLPYCGY